MGMEFFVWEQLPHQIFQLLYQSSGLKPLDNLGHGSL